jgi:hypothetical protein
MAIQQTIEEARKRGATDDQILAQIERANPQKSATFAEARKRGANSSLILSKIQESNVPTTETQQPAGKSFGRKALDFVGSVVGGSKTAEGLGYVASNVLGTNKAVASGIQGVTDSQSELLKRIREKQARGEDVSQLLKAAGQTSGILKQLGSSAQDVATGGITTRDIVGSSAQLATNLVPGAIARGGTALGAGKAGANVAARTLANPYTQSIATGYASDVASSIADEEQGFVDILKPGFGTALGIAIPYVGGKIKNLPKNLERSNLGQLRKVDRRILAGVGEDEIVDFASKQKFVGTPQARFEKSKNLAKKFSEAVDDKLKTVKPLSKKEVISAFRELTEEFADSPTELGDAQRLADEFESFLKSYKNKKVDGVVLNKFRQSYDTEAYSETAKVSSNVAKKAADKLRTLLQSQDEQLPTLFDDLQKATVYKKLLERALDKSPIGNIAQAGLSTTGGITGLTLGGPIGAVVGSVAGAAAPAIASGVATPARSAVGATAQTIGQGVGRGTKIGNDVLESIAQNLGVERGGNIVIPKATVLNLIRQMLGGETADSQE